MNDGDDEAHPTSFRMICRLPSSQMVAPLTWDDLRLCDLRDVPGSRGCGDQAARKEDKKVYWQHTILPVYDHEVDTETSRQVKSETQVSRADQKNAGNRELYI